MFKAKPIIPPGRILLELEREKEKNKIRGPKMKVGNTEISLFSPVRGDRKYFKIDEYNKDEGKSEPVTELNFSKAVTHNKATYKVGNSSNGSKYR